MARSCFPSLLAIGLATMPAMVSAQLLRDQVQANRRVCTYVGSEQLPNDATIARSLTIEASQECPAAPPYRQPTAPGNARLVREATDPVQRVCTYEQGGSEYPRPVPLSMSCAMTPSLLDRALTSAR